MDRGHLTARQDPGGSGPTRFALIIGAMKSGTTSLFEILGQHPEIASARVKETDFFCQSGPLGDGWNTYVDFWDWDPSRHRVALEASPSYATFPARPDVPHRIKEVESLSGAEFRLIYLMRNPLTQIPSAVRHTLYSGWGRTVDEGIPEWMIDNVRYSMQIDRYLEFFPRERMLLLTIEEFRDRPAAVLARVCRFLGVEAGFAFDDVAQRYNKGDAYELSPFWASVVKFQPLRAMAYRLLPRRVRHRMRALLPRIASRRGSLGRYQLTPSEQQTLIEELAPDLHRLATVHGVDIRRYWDLSPSDEAEGAEG